MLVEFGSRQRARGFTLVELMIVIVIVAVLAAIALPAYQNQVRKGNRAAAQAEMLNIANLQQQYLLSNRTYMDLAALTATGYSLDPDVARNYTFTLTITTVSVPTYTLRFTPSGSQGADGWLQIDSAGGYDSQYGDKWDR